VTPRRRKNVIAVTPGGEITEEMILGYITLFTVPDRAVSASKLNRTWISEGLPHTLIPQSRRSVNAFQVACRSVETRRRTEATRTREVEVDQVHETADKCVYQVTFLVRDKSNEIIEHPKALRVFFDKHTEAITWEALDKNVDQDQVNELGSRIRDFYDANAKKVPAARVREAIRKLMDVCDATNLRKKAGGVYMVPRTAIDPEEGREFHTKDWLDSLSKVLNELWGGDAEVNQIPCANAETEREMVARHFDINVTDEIDEIMAKATEALSRPDRSMRQDAIGNMIARRKVLAERTGRYRDLLDTELGEVDTKLELLDQQLEAVVLAKAGD